jgi:teichuronic acid biosynthesis glycosyltransferase TuaG
MQISKLISIVIPIFNSAEYISECISSVINQTYTDIEIICIDDGSTDNTKQIIKNIDDSRVKYFYQNNAGVSSARNLGLKISAGEYIIFLDSDDVLTNTFIEDRLFFLLNNPQYKFCCSTVKTISINSSIKEQKTYFGTKGDIVREITTYDQDINTCPSSYLINKNILLKKNITFCEDLTSTADRYFLLQIAQYTNCGFVNNSPLYYRIHPNSMSKKLNINLVNDNRLFQKKVLILTHIPSNYLNTFELKSNYILFGASFHTKDYLLATKYAIKTFCNSPINFFYMLLFTISKQWLSEKI